MNDERKDRELGMAREITRRDFLNGVAVGAGASVLGAGFSAECLLAAAILDEPAGEQAEEYYPPAKMGLRGDNDGSYTYAHKLRDGESPNARGEPVDTGESYDLIIVGAGISGLAAAYRFRQESGERVKILLLDNHDDFGGHARRNEFQVAGRLLLSNGGTQSIESPGEYSAEAKGLLKELGIDTSVF